ncbi:unnamed protein product [Ilex paraguariensis]|uniref:Uncharacterized protein n=1 Tax=Ilex paraguariensis TaxID=185542 RepID=A0ABC8U0U9_9AQUA
MGEIYCKRKSTHDGLKTWGQLGNQLTAYTLKVNHLGVFVILNLHDRQNVVCYMFVLLPNPENTIAADSHSLGKSVFSYDFSSAIAVNRAWSKPFGLEEELKPVPVTATGTVLCTSVDTVRRIAMRPTSRSLGPMLGVGTCTELRDRF